MSNSRSNALSAEQILSSLASEGFRLTQSRRHLIEFILKQKGHWTIQTLVDRVAKTLPSLGVATVYRTVGLLKKKNFLTETAFGDEAVRYEVCSKDHHDHLRCLDCGEIFEFENDEIERLQKSAARKLGFQLENHHMELFGRCQIEACPRKPARGRPSSAKRHVKVR